MANLNGFDANAVEPNATFEPVPAGKYLAAIINSEMKPTKKGDGQYLELTFQILDGEYKGRNLWSRLNLVNSNQATVQIARAELSALCRAVGVMSPKDSIELHNLPLLIRVLVKNRADTGEPTNVIRGYFRRESAAAPPTNGAKPPWKK